MERKDIRSLLSELKEDGEVGISATSLDDESTKKLPSIKDLNVEGTGENSNKRSSRTRRTR